MAGTFDACVPGIAALNPDTTLPDLFITAVHRSDDSGTTNNFADYLFQAAAEVWTPEPSDSFTFESGEGAAQTSGVVSADGQAQAAESAGSAPMSADLRETVSEIMTTISEGTGHEGGPPAPDKGDSTAIRPTREYVVTWDSGDLDKLDQRGGCSISVGLLAHAPGSSFMRGYEHGGGTTSDGAGATRPVGFRRSSVVHLEVPNALTGAHSLSFGSAPACSTFRCVLQSIQP